MPFLDPDTVFDVAELTAATRARIEMAEQTQVEIVEAEWGRAKLRMPLDGNRNFRIEAMYAGALFTVAELPGGTIFHTTFENGECYPIAKGLEIKYLRRAQGDITVESSMSADEIARVEAEVTERGKSDFDLEMELVDESGAVVAVSTNHYQLRRSGT